MVHIALLATIALAATSAPPPKPFASLREIHSSVAAVEKGADPDAFWQRVLARGTMPLIFGENAVFLWRGEARSVAWRGDFSSWEPSPESMGRRLGSSDIWVYERSFPPDARLDYKLVLDGSAWALDPLNPNTQLGGYGPNSEVRMPGWRPPENTVRREGVPRGTLSGDIPIVSRKLGYSVNYRVYTPNGFDRSTSKRLPVIYLTDGSDYWTDGMGGLVITLDNLIAERKIGPVLAVFIDPWDRKEGVNRRQSELIPAPDRSCPFCEFVAEELVQAIDEGWPTKATRESRAIAGTSLGGLNATLMATRYATLFGLAGIQSPAYGPAPWVAEDAVKGQRPLKAFIDAGSFENGILVGARDIADRYRRAGVEVQYVEMHQGHSWGQWRAVLDDMLVFFFPIRP